MTLNVDAAIEAGLYTGRSILGGGGDLALQATAFHGNQIVGGVVPPGYGDDDDERLKVIRGMAIFVALCEADGVSVIADSYIRSVPAEELPDLDVRPSADPLAVEAVISTVIQRDRVVSATQEYRRADDGSLQFKEPHRFEDSNAGGVIVREMTTALHVAADPPTMERLHGLAGSLGEYVSALSESGYVVALVEQETEET